MKSNGNGVVVVWPWLRCCFLMFMDPFGSDVHCGWQAEYGKALCCVQGSERQQQSVARLPMHHMSRMLSAEQQAAVQAECGVDAEDEEDGDLSSAIQLQDGTPCTELPCYACRLSELQATSCVPGVYTYRFVLHPSDIIS